MKHFIHAVVIGCCMVFLAGCGLMAAYGLYTPPQVVQVSVNSINDPIRLQGKKYVLFSGDAKISDNDLQFREFAGYVRKILSSLGYVEVNSPPAEIAIFMRYGMGQPTRVDYSSSSPVFGFVGGGTSSFTAFSSGGQVTMGTISSAPQLGVVGQNYNSGSYCLYSRWLRLEAVDLVATGDTKNPVISWQTTVVSSGRFADLRLIFPYLIVAAKDYIGENTGKIVNVVMRMDDKRVSVLRAKEGITYQSPNTEWDKRATALQAAQDWQGLLEWCRKWTKSEPENVVAWGTLGEAYSGLRRYDDAVEAYRQIIRIAPELALSWSSLGGAYLHLYRYNDAVEAYRQAIKLDPELADAQTGIGTAYDGLKRYDDAVEAYRQAIRIDPKVPGVWMGLGNAYDGLNRYNDAVEAYQQAIKIDPRFAPAWSNLGLTYSHSGNRTAALDAVRELRRLDPAMADKLFNQIAPR